HYVDPSLDSAGDGITNWTKMLWYGTLANGAASDTDSDGFTFAQELQRGFSPRVADELAQGGVSRRRGSPVTVNSEVLNLPPAIGVNEAVGITPASERLTAQVNPVHASATAYF